VWQRDASSLGWFSHVATAARGSPMPCRVADLVVGAVDGWPGGSSSAPAAGPPNPPMQLTPLRVREIVPFLTGGSSPSAFPTYRWQRN